jgi:uncharacterized protein with NRDE domain
LGVSVLSKDSSKIETWMKARHDIHALRKVLSEDELKRALRIYKGLETDSRQSFNPEEFMPKAGSTTVPVSTEKTAVSVQVDDDDLSLADDDFIKDLRSNIGTDVN